MYNPTVHHRRSIRLPNYDYRTVGAYFVTICTFERECFLADPELARIVGLSWRSANAGWEPRGDEFVVMPNHVHGIVWIRRERTVPRYLDLVRAQCTEEQTDELTASNSAYEHCDFDEGAAPLHTSGSLSAVMRSFKSLSTKRINHKRVTPGSPVWQQVTLPKVTLAISLPDHEFARRMRV